VIAQSLRHSRRAACTVTACKSNDPPQAPVMSDAVVVVGDCAIRKAFTIF